MSEKVKVDDLPKLSIGDTVIPFHVLPSKTKYVYAKPAQGKQIISKMIKRQTSK